MKLSRRCFLSLTIGGAVGTALTPLPWKLTDDLSIWSQNWPWTPVPPDGEYSYVNSTCTLCPGHCGIRVRKVNDRAVKIEGQDNATLNQGGGLCPLGMSGLQLLYGPTRVPGPLKRSGERGEGRWEAITWPQAIEEVASRLADIRSQGKPQTVACLSPADVGTVPKLLQRLMTAYGSPNYFRMPSVQDAYESVLSLNQGTNGFAGLDVENADFILSFGSALLEGYGTPVRMIQAVSRLKEKNGTLVQVEQRLSNTAAKADIWLSPKPGSEADLALAMAYALIHQGRYHQEFAARHIEGFESFAAMVKERYAPQAVAAISGVDADVIVRTALAFANARRPLAIYGKGKGETPGSLKEALAVHALNALVGNINREGGVLAMSPYDYLNWPEVPSDEAAAAGLQTQRLDGAGSKDYPHVRYLVNRLTDRLLTSPGELQALLVAEANPCHSLPDSARVREAFGTIPFIVSFSSFMDETALLADLILPNHVYLERYEDVPVLAGTTRPTIGLCQPVVAPVLDTRHVGDTIIQIARALEGPVAQAFPWADYESCLQEALGDQWDAISDQGYWAAEAAPAPWENGFNTASGKFVLMNAALEAIYLTDVPMPAGDEGGFPWLLVPYDSIRLNSRYAGDPPFMMKILPDTVLKGQDGFVELNPETAARIGLREGQTAQLSTPVGLAKVRVHLDDGVMPGILSMPRGLGHTAHGPFLAGKGVDINELIAPVEDPASGLDAVWGIRAKLTEA
ncbi:MAG: molybdopterin oxidoreductase [Desulfobacteraceae bacterium]|nr:MAG: molybdopterin oxidoreductase [Desulfobacteraceae bacterium]